MCIRDRSYTFDEQLRYEIVKSTVTNKIEPTNKNNTYRSIKPKQDENQFIDVVLKTKNLSKKEYILKDIYQGTFVINHQSYKASLAIENLKYNQISQTDTLKEDEDVYKRQAHRLSTVRNSNAIMVLDHGEIIERGSHDELIAQKGRYYQLYTCLLYTSRCV